MRLSPILASAVGCLLLAAGAGAASTPAGHPARGQSRPAGTALASVVRIQPGVVEPETAQQRPPTTAFCRKNYKISCYLPRQIEEAYGTPALYRRGVTGKGQTIVIVDSFGSPTVRHDLQRFDSVSGLPAPPKLTIIQPAGRVPPYTTSPGREGWAAETNLDVEYAHAMAPGANILLVETPTSENEGTTGFPQIVKAENYVINHRLGSVISQSFSATEQTFPNRRALVRLRGAYRNAAAHQVTVLAASGDSGAADVRFNGLTYYLHPVTSWPDSDPLVTGVGGVQLHLNAAGRHVRPDNVWNDTYNRHLNNYFGERTPTPVAGGGGKSVFFARPSYQRGVRRVVGRHRGVPDISMSAACNGAVDVYQSFGGQPAGWYPTCGTSEATPEFAGIVALADQLAGHPLGLINPLLYRMLARHARGLVDITRGNNTVTFRQGGRWHTVHGFRARRGYDLASGVGTVNAPPFVREIVKLASHRHHG